MFCTIFKGRKAPDTYLFLPSAGALEDVPLAVREGFGPLEHVMDLTLTPHRRLARVDAVTLMRRLLRDGCFIQLPPDEEAGTAGRRLG